MSQLDSVLHDLDASSAEIEQLEQEIDQLETAIGILECSRDEQREHNENAWANLQALVPVGSVAFGVRPSGERVAVVHSTEGVSFHHPAKVLMALTVLAGA